MKTEPSRRRIFRMVIIISAVIALLVPMVSVFANHQKIQLVRHNITFTRVRDMPCIEDPSGAFDYVVTTMFTVLVLHDDEHALPDGYEHVVGVRIGKFSAVPRFDPELPSYEGRSFGQVTIEIVPSSDGLQLSRGVSKIKAEGSDGSQIDFKQINKFLSRHGEVLLDSQEIDCR